MPIANQVRLNEEASKLRDVLADVDRLFAANWKSPCSASTYEYRKFRLYWAKDTKGRFRLQCGPVDCRKDIDCMGVTDLIATAKTVPALWKALEGQQESLIAKAKVAQDDALRFISDHTRPIGF